MRRNDERPITGTGNYNLNFIDWDNEYEQVFDHLQHLRGTFYLENGLNYQDSPYFDVPYSELASFLSECEDFDGPGLSEAQIRQLEVYRGKPKECSICLDTSGDGLKLLCGHIFHRDCILKWLRCRTICPNCRQRAIN